MTSVGLAKAVHEWLSAQPPWQQDLARRLTAIVELDPDELTAVLGMVYTSFGLPSAAAEPQAASPGQLTAADGSAVRLLAFGRLRGVGLVVEDGEVEFGREGLTIIYGQNAAGKSSYVRGLKMLCRTVDHQCCVRASIYEQAHERPSAKLEIEAAGQITASRVPLDRRDSTRLPGIAVFDATCAELYVTVDNTIQYIPAELRLLTRMAVAQDRMRKIIEAELASVRASAPSMQGFPVDTEVYVALSGLTGAASDPDLAALATLTEAQTSRRSELRATVAAVDASTGRPDALAAQADAAEAAHLAESLSALAKRGDATACQRLREAAAADLKAQRALRLANEEFFTGPVVGLGGSAWRTLWNAARDFVDSGGGRYPPTAGDACPLCLQALNAEAADRMAHFEEHVKSTVQEQSLQAAARLTAALADSDPAHADSCRTPFLTGLYTREPELATQLEAAIAGIAAQLTMLHADPTSAAVRPDRHSGAIRALTKWASSRSAHAGTLLAAEDPTQMVRMRQEIAELDARQLLGERLEEFQEWQQSLRRAISLRQAHTGLATNKITSKQRLLTDSYLSQGLKAALAAELGRLRCSHLPVTMEMKTARAETNVSLRLVCPQSADLSDIVSEGERRAVALSFFFAELSVVQGDGGIILDDPVSSLDDERTRYIADRLVDEAKRRQVIIFTHDLPFVVDLQGQAKESDVPVKVQGIWRLGQDVGRVDTQPPFKVMNLRQRLGQLKERVAQWESQPTPANFDEAWRRVTGFYADLRTSWERAVEERLFRGVVQRFQREVKTLALKEVTITPELIRQVEAGMTRASEFVHDEPPSGPVSLPGRPQLAADLEGLIKFEQETRAK